MYVLPPSLSTRSETVELLGVAQLQKPVRFRPALMQAREMAMWADAEGKGEKKRQDANANAVGSGALLEGLFFLSHAFCAQRCSRSGLSSPDFCRLPSISRFQAQYSPKRSSA